MIVFIEMRLGGFIRVPILEIAVFEMLFLDGPDFFIKVIVTQQTSPEGNDRIQDAPGCVVLEIAFLFFGMLQQISV